MQINEVKDFVERKSMSIFGRPNNWYTNIGLVT